MFGYVILGYLASGAALSVPAHAPCLDVLALAIARPVELPQTDLTLVSGDRQSIGSGIPLLLTPKPRIDQWNTIRPWDDLSTPPQEGHLPDGAVPSYRPEAIRSLENVTSTRARDGKSSFHTTPECQCLRTMNLTSPGEGDDSKYDESLMMAEDETYHRLGSVKYGQTPFASESSLRHSASRDDRCVMEFVKRSYGSPP